MLAGSHGLVAPYLSLGEAFRLERVRTSLAGHPWLRGLWRPGEGDGGDGCDRTQRYMNDGTTVDGVPLRVVELTGEPGDVILMHSDTFHAVASNRLTAADDAHRDDHARPRPSVVAAHPRNRPRLPHSGEFFQLPDHDLDGRGGVDLGGRGGAEQRFDGP